MTQQPPIEKICLSHGPSEDMSLNHWKNMVLTRMIGDENAARIPANRTAIPCSNRQVTRQIDIEIEAAAQKALSQSKR